ncbi:MAG TPA: hypothetical protein VF614_13625 [Chthoniobacteraceae bacterium]
MTLPLTTSIESALVKIAAGEVESALEELRTALLSADPREAIAAITQFLATGRDAVTGQDFTPGEGELEAAPTLRVFLMDLLGRLSKQTQTADGAKIGRAVLETRNSPDEWAISLRNVAWQEPKATSYLANKFRELIDYGPWRQSPTGGMLEAFDVAVFTRDVRLVPDLTNLLTSGEEDLERAAAVALDRLSETAPLEVMNQLNANPGMLADLPLIRADHFSKANLANPQQRQAVEYYLARADVTLQEKSKFLKVVATPASFISENLLTESAPPDDDPARRRGLATATADWIKSGRFPEIQLQIAELNTKLNRP